jgi:hypothetical protein
MEIRGRTEKRRDRSDSNSSIVIDSVGDRMKREQEV